MFLKHAIRLVGIENWGAKARFPKYGKMELVANKYPLASAAWFWNKNGLNEIADKGATDAVVKSITKRVNGG